MMDITQTISYTLLTIAYLTFIIPHYFFETVKHFKNKFTIITYIISIILIFGSIFYIFSQASTEKAIDPVIAIGCGVTIISIFIINYFYNHNYIRISIWWINITKADDKRQDLFVDIALDKLKSRDLSKQYSALLQLSELALDDRAYGGLLEFIAHNRDNKLNQFLYIEYLSRMNRKRANYICKTIRLNHRV